MSGPDVDALVATLRELPKMRDDDHHRLCATRHPAKGGDECDCYARPFLPARTAVRSLAALARSAAEMESKLEDIATREWRDEGGRIAAAIARDALAARSREQQEPQA